jgi:ABC-2 type transport system ATP-binding protein
MRHLSALTVEVTFDGVVPDVTHVAGVDTVQVQGRTLRCQVHGPVGPLLSELAGKGVHEFLSREPSLEELFLSHYGSAVPEVVRANGS